MSYVSEMTTDDKVALLLRLGWTIRVFPDPDDGGFVARVAELPAVLATGDTQAALEADLRAALEATLRGYLHCGDPIPLPEAVTRLPWEDPQPSARDGSVTA